MEERLIEIFKEYLPAWSWEEWQAAGASDKEDIVINALADLGPDMPIEADEAYDIFYDWIAGLTAEDFGETITEDVDSDPYGYGPYKTFSDPTLSVGDYVLTTRPFSKESRTYPARITSVSPKWIEYEISGFGFKDRGTKARPGSTADQALRNARTYMNNLGEAVRVVSDPDVLYHATEVGPFYDILNSGVMLHDVRNEGGVHAICFTTDDNYTIYGYPCKIKFSRSKLEQDGYELYPVDEFEDDYGRGESEERCDQDINDVRKYVTEVIIDWEFIAVAQDGDDYRLSTGEYDEEGNESDNWDLRLSDFQALLDSLKASGIKVIEKGQPEADDDYWFDETGEFKYGREPALV